MKNRGGKNIKAHPNIGRAKFLRLIKSFVIPSELEKIETAYIFAKYGHRNQMRDDQITRYFEHPKAVTLILIQELQIFDWHAIVLGLLHDIKEDSFILSWEMVQKIFGPTVTRGLKVLTKEPKKGYEKRLIQSENKLALTVKLCDRLHNMRTINNCSKEKIERKIKETEKKYLPIADMLIARLPAKDRWKGEYLKDQIMNICQEALANEDNA